MTRRALAVFVLLVVPAPALAQQDATTAERAWYAGSIVAVGVTTVGDDFSTVEGIATGRFKEGSPVLVRADGSYNRGLKYAISGGVTTANHFFVWRRGQRKSAVVVNITLAAVQGVAWAHNERLIRVVTSPEPLPDLGGVKFRIRF